VPGCLLLAPALILASSLSPYVGLKTVPTLSMFSNLRTEGERPNHLFMPARLKVFGYQDDLVEVVEANHPAFERLQRQGLLLPWFEFNRQLHRVGAAMPPRRPLVVRYVRGGEEHVVRREPGSDGSDLEPIPWHLDKLLRFRAIDKEGPNRARW
jgi:hypothetical protein